MTDKERKARDERVRLRREVDRLKQQVRDLEANKQAAIRSAINGDAKYRQLLECYQLLCNGLGHGVSK